MVKTVVDSCFNTYSTSASTGASTNEGVNMSADTTTEQVTSEPISTGIVLTDAAALKVKTLLDAEGRDDLTLRVAVQPGGCSGLRYQLFFDDRSLDGDVIKDYNGVGVVTDRMSAPYLGGATIDFVDTIEKQGFTIDNPNAGSSCACGDSFS
jgi:iron-sulfur cluster assembly accessory protein